MDFCFSSSYPTDATYQIWLRLTLYFWEEDDKDGRRSTTHYDGRQAISEGHPSDSGNPKSIKIPGESCIPLNNSKQCGVY